MAQIKLKVIYEPYARYEPTYPVIGHITAGSFREAIIKMLDKVRMYSDGDEILEQEEELGRQMTQDELIDLLNQQNGDGCDYITSLTNELTGETYITESVPTDEWYA